MKVNYSDVHVTNVKVHVTKVKVHVTNILQARQVSYAVKDGPEKDWSTVALSVCQCTQGAMAPR